MANEIFNVASAYVPDSSVGEFKESTQTYGHTFSGLPPGARGQLVDNLFRIFSQHGLKVEACIIRTFVVPKSGKLTFTGLRDSIYSLLINTPGYAKFNQYNVSVGDPTKFNVVNRFTYPSPAQISEIAVGIGEDQTPYAKVTWALSARGQTGIYKLEYRVSGATSWVLAQDALNANVRTFTIGSLEYGETYEFRLSTQTPDGTIRGTSDIKSATTPDAPEGMVDEAVVIVSGYTEEYDGTHVTAANMKDSTETYVVDDVIGPNIAGFNLSWNASTKNLDVIETVAIPDSLTKNYGGTATGDVTGVQTLSDGNVYSVVEATAAPEPGFDIDFNFTSLTFVPNTLRVHQLYDQGANPFNHDCYIQMYDYVAGSFQFITGIRIHYSPFAFYYIEIPIDPVRFIGAPNAIVKILHSLGGSAGHTMYVDYVALSSSY